MTHRDMTRVLLLFFFAALVGCHSDGKQPSVALDGAATGAASASGGAAAATGSSAAAEAPKEPAFPKITLKDKGLVVTHGVAFSIGGEAVTIELSTHEVDCASYRKMPMPEREGEARIQLTAAKPFASDSAWVVTRTLHREYLSPAMMDRPASGSKSTFEVADVKGWIDATVDLKGHVTAKGPLRVKGCGMVKPDVPNPRPQKELSVQLNKHKVAITHAVLDDSKLHLSTEPVKFMCGSNHFGFGRSDVEFEIAISGSEATGFRLGGDRLAQNKSYGPLDKKKATIGTVKDGLVPIELDVSHGAIHIKGKVSAKKCE